jgi:hypothetical protein
MRVLVIEHREREAEAAVEALSAAGHRVSFCHEPGTEVMDCNGMPGKAGCPLDHGGIDVTVVGRSTPVTTSDGAEPSAREAGIGCAKRHRVPVVIAGTIGEAIPPTWATDIVAVGDPYLVERIDAAARKGRVPLVEAAEGAARAVLERSGLGSVPLAGRVARDDRRLHVTVDVAAELDDRLRETIGVRVAGAVRAIETSSPSIDVRVLTPSL